MTVFLCFENHHGHCILSIIGKAQMDPTDAPFTANLQGSPVKLEAGFPGGFVKHLDIPPPDALPHPQPQGLGKGLLGCEAKCKGRMGDRTGIAEGCLPGCKHAVHKTFLPPTKDAVHPAHLHQINAGSADHGRRGSGPRPKGCLSWKKPCSVPKNPRQEPPYRAQPFPCPPKPTWTRCCDLCCIPG